MMGQFATLERHINDITISFLQAKPPARPKNLRPWQPPAPSQPFRGQSHHRYQSAGRTMNRPGGSGRFTTLQNRR